MLDVNHLCHSAAPLAASGLFAALKLASEARSEFEQLQSLLEAGIAESSAAVALDCPARVRAMNIGRVARDVLAANARLLGEVEAWLAAQHAAATAEATAGP